MMERIHHPTDAKWIANYSTEAICVTTQEVLCGYGSNSVAVRYELDCDEYSDQRYFLLPESMYSSLFRDLDAMGEIFFPWNSSVCPYHLNDVFSNFLTLRKRKNFLCIGAGSGYVNFLAADMLRKGGVNHGLEMAENLFRECQMRARDIEWNLPALQTHITFPTFFKTPARLFNAGVRYDSIFCNRYVTFEDAWWIASFLSDGGVMICPNVANGEEEGASMLFSKATTLSVERFDMDMRFLLRVDESDLVLLDVRGAMSADNLSTLCLQIISESLWRKFRQENPSDVENKCTDIRLDWRWNFYMQYKTWFDELLYKTKQSITLMYTFLLRVTESEANECLKTTKSLTELIDNIKYLIPQLIGFASSLTDVHFELPNIQPEKLAPACFIWSSSLGIVLSSSLKYLQAAAINTPNIWCSLKIELDRLTTDEEETSYDIFDMKLHHPESRSLEICWGLRRAVCFNMYKVLKRYFEFVEFHRSNVSTASPRVDVDYLLDFKQLLTEFSRGVGSLLNDCHLTFTCSPPLPRYTNKYKSCREFQEPITNMISKVQLWNDCFQSAIQMSLDDTQISEMNLMTFELKLYGDIENGLSRHVWRHDLEDTDLMTAENILRISQLFSPPHNDRVNLSLNIPRLILSCLRQISSLLSAKFDVRKSVRHRYHDFLDKNASQLFPPALWKIFLSKLRDM